MPGEEYAMRDAGWAACETETSSFDEYDCTKLLDSIFGDTHETAQVVGDLCTPPLSAETIAVEDSSVVDCGFFGIGFANCWRMLRTYELEINSIFPMFSVYELQNKLEDLGTLYRSRGSVSSAPERDLVLMKLAISCSAAVSDSLTDTIMAMYEDCRRKMEPKIVSGQPDLYIVLCLWFMTLYELNREQESQAYRLLGFASVLVTELGLHSRERLSRLFPVREQADRCRMIFWCIYVLDRRLAQSTNKPYILRDENIEQQLPQCPDLINEDERQRYLHMSAMVEYTRLAAKVWTLASSLVGSTTDELSINVRIDAVDELGSSIDQWKQELPIELQFGDPFAFSSTFSVKLPLYLRLNHNYLVATLNRPFLYAFSQNLSFAIRAVDVSLDSIRLLWKLHFEYSRYLSSPVQYHYFFISALGVLVTGIVHAPVLIVQLSQNEWSLALDLLKLLSPQSKIAKRLLRTVNNLKASISPDFEDLQTPGSLDIPQLATDLNDLYNKLTGHSKTIDYELKLSRHSNSIVPFGRY
ncbi:fungal-specific transcription factor domain-containing protein [Lipomyces oligophaga]|uniref:fungal-specific transcription factor domain-containing protein n=1 Tax=Lipomyces oligophaga TaxID=45792 RepID=UPI0034CDD74D